MPFPRVPTVLFCLALPIVGCAQARPNSSDLGTERDLGTGHDAQASVVPDAEAIADASVDAGAMWDTDSSVSSCGPVNDFCAGAGAGQVCLIGGYLDRGNEAAADSSPVERVFVQTFAIDSFEVTVARYRDCAALGDCTLPGGDAELAYYRDDSNLERPIMGLTLDQMAAFCRAAGGRLPTESEWERAARGLAGREQPWGSGPPTCGGVNANGCEAGPATVGAHAMDRTPEAVFDLLGNVAEATSDRWEDGGYLAYADGTCDPGHPTRVPGDRRIVVRGCSWRSDPGVDCSGYLRRASQRFAGTDDVGFRCATRW